MPNDGNQSSPHCRQAPSEFEAMPAIEERWWLVTTFAEPLHRGHGA